MKQYMIATNVDGCLIGDYYSEIITNFSRAKRLLELIKTVDPMACIVEVVSVKKRRTKTYGNKKSNYKNSIRPRTRV